MEALEKLYKQLVVCHVEAMSEKVKSTAAVVETFVASFEILIDNFDVKFVYPGMHCVVD